LTVNNTTDTQRGADGAGRVYSLMVCRVCGADSHDEVCPECRNGVNFMQERGSGCAICDGMAGMPVVGSWVICLDCSALAMGAGHWRDSNNRSVVMVDPEKFVQGVRRIRDLTEQRDALVAALEQRDALIVALQEKLGTPPADVTPRATTDGAGMIGACRHGC
jgi:hypothetical protein